MKRIASLILFVMLGAACLAQIVPGSGGVGGTITGQIQTATGGSVTGGTLTFSLSQPAIVSNTATLSTTPVACYTSASGNIVGVPDPAALPIVSTNILTGTLPAATYYVVIYYYNVSGVSAVSPELSIVLSAQGSLVINPPVLQPASATAFGVAISTTSGAETVQGAVTSWTQFSQSVPLIAGTAAPVINTSSCNIYFSDQLIPTGTNYTVNLINKRGSQVAGFPQTWCTYGGAGGVINVSQGAPTGSCNVNGVFYPTPIFSNVPGGSQSVVGPISFLSPVSFNGGGTLNGTFTGNPTFAGNLTFGAGLTVFNFNNIRYVDGVHYPFTAAGITSAIADATNAGGGTVYVGPAGSLSNYNGGPLAASGSFIPMGASTITLPSGVCLRGVGNHESTVLRWTGTPIGPHGAAVYLPAGTQYACLQGLTLDFAPSAATNAVGIGADANTGAETLFNTIRDVFVNYEALGAGSAAMFVPGVLNSFSFSLNTIDNLIVSLAASVVACQSCEGNFWRVNAFNSGNAGLALFSETQAGDEQIIARLESGSSGNGTNGICYATSGYGINAVITCDSGASGWTAISDQPSQGGNTYQVSLIGTATLGTVSANSTATVNQAGAALANQFFVPSVTVGNNFGSSISYGSAACETNYGITTLSGASTNTGLSCLPANAIIDAVLYRITTTITTAASFTIGDSGSATRYCGTQSTLTAGTTGICVAAGYYFNAGALAVKITPNASPGAGAMRLIVYYHSFTPPTS